MNFIKLSLIFFFIKDKLIEIETYNQNIAKEQIELNKLEAKRHLEVKIEKNIIWCNLKLLKAAFISIRRL